MTSSAQRKSAGEPARPTPVRSAPRAGEPERSEPDDKETVASERDSGEHVIEGPPSGVRTSPTDGAEPSGETPGPTGLTPEEADRIADSIRPSWEAPPPEEGSTESWQAAVPAAPRVPVDTSPSPATGPAEVTPGSEPGVWTPKSAPAVSDSIPSLATPVALPRRGTNRAVWLGVAGLGALLIVGLSFALTGDDEAPETTTGAEPPDTAGTAVFASSSRAADTEEAPTEEAAPVAEAPSAEEDEAAGPALVGDEAAEGEGPASESSEDDPADPAQTTEEAEANAAAASASENEPTTQRPRRTRNARQAAARRARQAEAAPGTVRLRVRTIPTNARLFMDGTPVANPFDARLNAGGSHRLEARAPGYAPASRTIRFDRSRAVTLRLRRDAPAPRGAPRRPGRGAGFVGDSPY